MSVLKNKRSESKAEFVNTANEIYTRTFAFISRLSARYARLMADKVEALASDVADYAEIANSIYPSDTIKKEDRERALLRSRGALMALDVKLCHCYLILSQNPQGAFEKLKAAEARERLDDLSQTVGELIDKENAMLTSLIKQLK